MLRKPFLVSLLLWCLVQPSALADDNAESLVIGDSFIIESKILDEARRINVFTPSYYGEPINEPMPVIYMPDGGVNEDFVHIAGLVNVLVMNGSMRPFRLVGIENTERRRDLTGPTDNPEDRKIAPRVGGSAAFRKFLREELMPQIKARYSSTEEAAIVGESLAGLFVVETLVKEPALFDHYIAIDPSLWWNRRALLNNAAQWKDEKFAGKSLYFAASSEPDIAETANLLAEQLQNTPGTALNWHHAPMPEETHASIYHPAALQAFRKVFARRQGE